MRIIAQPLVFWIACVLPFLVYPFVLSAGLALYALPRPTQADVEQVAGSRDRASGTQPTAGASIAPEFGSTDSPQYFSHLATKELQEGRIDQAVGYFQLAIEHNPGDVGASYEIKSPKVLRATAVKHGNRQVRKMVADRPTMGEHTDEQDFLWRWAARKFAGEDLGFTIDWDPTPPPSSTLAEHTTPTESIRGCIRVAATYYNGSNSGRQRSFEELWSDAIFELHNIAHAPEFRAVTRAAYRGSLSKVDYVYALFGVEFEVMQTTRAFYIHEFLPWSRSKDIRSNPTLWFTDKSGWGTVRECFQQYRDPYSYPWGPYGTHYDQIQFCRSPETALK